MAILWTLTQHVYSEERQVLSSLQNNGILAGQGLEATPVVGAAWPNDSFVMQLANTNGGVLEGIAMAPKITGGSWFAVEQITVPASPYIVVLQHLAASNLIGVFLSTTGALIACTSGGATSSNVQYGTDATTGNSSLVFDSTLVGKVYNVCYNYATTPFQDRLLLGDVYPGQSQLQTLGKTGVFKIGRIAVNNLDPKGLWFASSATGAVALVNGNWTDATTGSGGLVPGSKVRVVSYPTYIQPWLVLDVNC